MKNNRTLCILIREFGGIDCDADINTDADALNWMDNHEPSLLQSLQFIADEIDKKNQPVNSTVARKDGLPEWAYQAFVRIAGIADQPTHGQHDFRNIETIAGYALLNGDIGL
jgi:hypothetical protein